jgi:hypothetical protein
MQDSGTKFLSQINSNKRKSTINSFKKKGNTFCVTLNVYNIQER